MMHVVYSLEQAPSTFSKSIFLAGPTPRHGTQLNWRFEALRLLEELGYDGVVFVPIPRDGNWGPDGQVHGDWQHRHHNLADVLLFWIPRDLDELLGLNTNVEFGMFYDSGKAVLGYPEGTPHMRSLDRQAKLEHAPVHNSLEATVRAALDHIGDGAERVGGERMVPVHIWRLQHFQQWLLAQKGAGNRLDGARLLWSFRVGPKKSFTFAYVLFVDIHIASEGRNKTNEFVIVRPDIATVIAYHKRIPLMDSEIVLIREFRSAARTTDGFIREVPSGSSWKPGEDPFVTAAHELDEEAGLTIDPKRLRKLGARQLCGTLAAHQAHAFACELGAMELKQLIEDNANGTFHGVVEDTERTYVEVHRLGDLMNPESNAVDWSMLGMILAALS